MKNKSEKEKIPMYIARSISLANWLCRNGFPILKIEDSYDNPKYKVLLFEDSVPLRKCVDKWLASKERM